MRHRTKIRFEKSTKSAMIVLQVSKQKNPGYKRIYLGSVHQVLIPPRTFPKKHGVWIQGPDGPVFLYKHEYKIIEKRERRRKNESMPAKVRRRTKKPTIRRRRKRNKVHRTRTKTA